MEIPKATPDYKNWIELSIEILKEKSKDIKVTSWLVFALYRSENIKGLNNGLTLMVHMLKKYGNDLFPLNPMHKVKGIQFISTSRITKLLEKEIINPLNTSEIIKSGKLLEDLTKECERLFPEEKPNLKSLNEVINTHIESANALLKKAEKPQEKPQEKLPEKPPETISPANPGTDSTVKSTETKPVQPVQVSLGTERDGLIQIRKTIQFFFEYDEDGTKKQRIPENYLVFGLSRQLQWSTLVRPIDTNGSTTVPAPNKVIQGLVKDWYTSNNYEMLIARIESEFVKENSEFRYWFDAQKYVVNLLEKRGGDCTYAANDIKIHLARLLNRIPDLPQLKYQDKQTPFADDDTIDWLQDVKKTSGINGTGNIDVLPPIIGEEYDKINKDYVTACNDIPQKFEKNLLQMQNAVNNEEGKKGKFLRRLNLANFCIMHKEYYLARINLLELKEIIQLYNLSDWESALSTAVWKSLYQANNEIISHTKDNNLVTTLNFEQEELFIKIAKYDGVLALTLNNIKNKR